MTLFFFSFSALSSNKDCACMAMKRFLLLFFMVWCGEEVSSEREREKPQIELGGQGRGGGDFIIVSY